MQEPSRSRVTLVLGGVRSGKSRYALKLAAGSTNVTFVATARPSDDEMRGKIARHQSERPAHWRTFEEPLRLAEALSNNQGTSDTTIIDCLTLFAANLMEAHEGDQAAIDMAIDDLCSALRNTDSEIVLVSNEVGSGVVPAHPAGRQFRDLLGEMNQRVAAVADNVVLLVAGLPLPIKSASEVLR